MTDIENLISSQRKNEEGLISGDGYWRTNITLQCFSHYYMANKLLVILFRKYKFEFP